MLLYHYAKRPYKTLKTRRMQRTLTDEELKDGLATMKFRGDPGPYYDHVSLFVEPLPLGLLASLYAGHNHRIWNEGQVVYEHVVESKDIGEFLFEMVETPFDLQYAADHWPEPATEANKKAYFAGYSRMKRQVGEVGKNEPSFESAAKKFVGKTAAAYVQASKTNDAEAMQRYAASVPHVMIYPHTGIIELVGPSRKEKITQTKLPPSADWRK